MFKNNDKLQHKTNKIQHKRPCLVNTFAGLSEATKNQHFSVLAAGSGQSFRVSCAQTAYETGQNAQPSQYGNKILWVVDFGP